MSNVMRSKIEFFHGNHHIQTANSMAPRRRTRQDIKNARPARRDRSTGDEHPATLKNIACKDISRKWPTMNPLVAVVFIAVATYGLFEAHQFYTAYSTGNFEKYAVEITEVDQRGQFFKTSDGQTLAVGGGECVGDPVQMVRIHDFEIREATLPVFVAMRCAFLIGTCSWIIGSSVQLANNWCSARNPYSGTGQV